MGRYSPTVIPAAPDPLDVVNRMWSGYLGYKQSERAEKGLDLEARGLDIREQESKQRIADQDLNRYSQGFRRGRAPQEVAQEELPPTLRRGASVVPRDTPPAMGMQPAEKGGIPALRDRLQEARGSYQPEIVAKPGALIPGVNQFAPRAVTAQELQPPRMVTQPGYEQVNEEYFYDPSGTPDARMLDRQIRYDESRQRLQQSIEAQELERKRRAAVGAGWTDPEALAVAEGLRLPTEANTGTGGLTMNQALTWAYRRHQKQVTDPITQRVEWISDGTPFEQIYQEALQFRGLGVGGGEGDMWEPEEPTPTPGFEGISFSDYADRYRGDPFGVRGEEGPLDTGEASVLTDAQVMEAREFLSDLETEEERIQELEALGFSSPDIDRIIRGG
jgi:hypothetical protein